MIKITRVDFIGNSNNYPLLLVHGMRSLGIDARLHLIHEGALNAPESRYPRYAAAYPRWIHDWRSPDMLSHAPEKTALLRQSLAGADALVLNHEAVFLGASETRPYFCLLTGSDLLTYGDPRQCGEVLGARLSRPVEPTEALYLTRWMLFLLQQRAAIRQCSGYAFFPSGTLPAGDELLEGLDDSSNRRFSFLLTDTEELQYTPPPRNTPMRVVYGARLTWDTATPPYRTPLDYKGTHMFLQGFARFIQSGGTAELHLFRKGDHIDQTEALLEELGLTALVRWNEEVNQCAFLARLREADVVVDALGDSSFGMVTLDALALGRPVIATAPEKGRWGIWDDFPLCHARTAEDVCVWLLRLRDAPDLGPELGKRGRDFAVRHFSPVPAAEHMLGVLRRPRACPLDAPLYRKLTGAECFGALQESLGELAFFRERAAALQLDLPRLFCAVETSAMARRAVGFALRWSGLVGKIASLFQRGNT